MSLKVKTIRVQFNNKEAQDFILLTDNRIATTQMTALYTKPAFEAAKGKASLMGINYLPEAQIRLDGDKAVCPLTGEVKGVVLCMDVEAESMRLSEERKQAKIVEVLASGEAVYFAFAGGDTGAKRVGIGKRVNGRIEQVAFTTVKALGEGIGFDDAETIAGWYGDVAIISQAQYEAILGIKQEAAQQAKAAAASAQQEREAKFEQARQTNQPVAISKEQGFDDEEGCVAEITTYAMPDGTTREKSVLAY